MGQQTMRAYRFGEWRKSAELEEVPVPEPGPGECLVRIGGAGACHSDLHIMCEWSPETSPRIANLPLPFTLGHENAGWIESGDGGGLDPGTPVVIHPQWNCGKCRQCRIGETNYCLYPSLYGGLGLDGGLADYMVVPTSSLLQLNTLEPWEAAPLTDAGLTSYHAVKRCLPDLTPDTATVVIGVGGLGHMAVNFLRELSATTIIAVDRESVSLELAKKLGAHHCLDSNDKTAAAIRDLTGGLGAAAVIDFVGLDATMAMASQVVRRNGQIAMVGLGGGTLTLGETTLPSGCTISYTVGGSKQDLAEVIALAEKGQIHASIEKYQLDQVSDVYAKLKNHEITGRAVLIP